jgi:hypothetical protein
MANFKDYIHAFKLSCEKFVDEMETSPFQSNDALSTAYYNGYKQQVAVCLQMVCSAMEDVLNEDDRMIPAECHNNPEAMMETYLEHMREQLAEERTKPDYINAIATSRQTEESLARVRKQLNLGEIFNPPKTDQEHAAFDRGVFDADRGFIEEILPELSMEYQNMFDPDEHPFQPQQGIIFQAPKYLM